MSSMNEYLSEWVFGDPSNKNWILALEVVILFVAFIVGVSFSHYLISAKTISNFGDDSTKEARFIFRDFKKSGRKGKYLSIDGESTSDSGESNNSTKSLPEGNKIIKRKSSKQILKEKFNKDWEKLYNILMPNDLQNEMFDWGPSTELFNRS